MKLIFKALCFVVAIFVTDWLLLGVEITQLDAGLMLAAVLTGVNLIIKPIIKFFTFGINILTLGLFPLVLNTVLILIIAFFVDGFKLYYDTYIFGFLWAFAFGFLLSIVHVVVEKVADFVL
ncbi:MAG: phage holin family protein [Microscillaceae bacterium]|nr:phage holin family protein [Microscillaceae bacterium]